ncbi:MAG: PQ-loop repeat-containing protein [Rickettsiales bacterium]
MNIINISGLIASITSIIGLMPQIYKTYQIKSAKDLSMVMLVNYFICSLAWIMYGFYTSASFVLYSNIIGLLSSVISIIQKVYYDRLQ